MEKYTQDKITNIIDDYTKNLKIADETFIAKIYLELQNEDKSIKTHLNRIIINSEDYKCDEKSSCIYSPRYNTIKVNLSSLNENINKNINNFFQSDNKEEKILLHNIEVVRYILKEFEQAKLIKKCLNQESFQNNLLKFSFESDLYRRSKSIKPADVKQEKYIDYILSEEDFNYVKGRNYTNPNYRIAFANSFININNILNKYDNDKINDYEKYIYLNTMLTDYYNKYNFSISPIEHFITIKEHLMKNAKFTNKEFEELKEKQKERKEKLDLKTRLIYGMEISIQEYDLLLYQCATTNTYKKSNTRIRK